MSYDTVINVKGLGKHYEIYSQPQDRLKQFLMPRLQHLIGNARKKYYRDFWALKDISFDVHRGETLGIIGRNGSGKSTLLQIISGILLPTEGEVTTKGRISALLELGAGFNTEFTGRENIYINAALLGLSHQEIENKIEDILAFADIGEFIEQPIKLYSSGMIIRLAFAIQSQVDPDILIVDEAIAVGDAKFQAKCFDRLKRLKENGTCILLVSHSTEQILTHCSKALLLNNGKQIVFGNTKKVVNTYLDLLFGRDKTSNFNISQGKPQTLKSDSAAIDVEAANDLFHTRSGYNKYEYRWGDRLAAILDYKIESDGQIFPSVINSGSYLNFDFLLDFKEVLFRPVFGLTLRTKDGILVYGINSEAFYGHRFLDSVHPNSLYIVRIGFDCILSTGDYFVSVGISTRDGDNITPHDRRYDSIHIFVQSKNDFSGLVNLKSELDIK